MKHTHTLNAGQPRATGIPATGKRVPAFSQSLAALLLCLGVSGAFAADSADYLAGKKAYDEGDMMGAMTPLRRAADLGEAPAQALLGEILDKAELNEQAITYLRKAADQDNPAGLYGLAVMYMTGDGVAEDRTEAAKLLRRSAALGHMPAKLALTQAYLNKDGRLGADVQDSPEARALLADSAEHGYLPAIDALAQAHRTGDFGLPVDPAKADALAKRAAEMRQAGRTRPQKK